MIITLIVQIICISAVGFCIYMLLRNHQTFKERTKVSKLIFKKDKNNKYLRHDGETLTLLREQDEIATYDKILFRFWKRPSSFYKEFNERIEKENKELMENDINV